MAQESATRKLFRIGEVSRITGIHPHILRYWESEGGILAPNRNLSKQRFYRQADIDLILTVKRLLEEEKYTLQGVRHYLAACRAAGAAPVQAAANTAPPEDVVIKMIREELRAILAVLDEKKSGA